MAGYLQLTFYIAALIFILSDFVKSTKFLNSEFRALKKAAIEEFDIRACYSYDTAIKNLQEAERLYKANYREQTSHLRKQIQNMLELPRSREDLCLEIPPTNHPTISNNSSTPYNWVITYE